jgi:hypothetical protein
MQILGYLLARFSEPSSYAGLGAVLAVLGLNFSDTMIGQFAQFLAAGCALAALFLKERGIIKSLVLPLVLTAGLAAAVALTACDHAAGAARKIDPRLAAACDAATALSPIAGPCAVWIDAGCGIAEAITRLAHDPASAAWVEKLIAQANQRRAASGADRA